MEKIKIGIICPSEIAYRRFMPAICKVENIEYVGVAIANQAEWNGAADENLIVSEMKKAEKFKETYGGKIFESYASLLESSELNAVYLPLPPALHYQWAKKALEHGKHVFVEKPSTTCLKDTVSLIEMAKEKGLALHENYMFIYHTQIEEIKKLMKDNEIGDLRLARASFGFPRRAANDFRYNKALGGGALLDCGGYPVKLMQSLLGNIKVDSANLYYENDIDLYGAVQLSTQEATAQISFGMDNSYKCELELWGSKGTIYTGRVFTAPEGMETTITVKTLKEEKNIIVAGDDSFRKSIKCFIKCVENEDVRIQEYERLEKQIILIQEIRERG